MQNNLEEIGFDEVSDESGRSYAVFRNSLQPRYGKVFLDIFKGYFFLAAIVAGYIFFYQRFPAYWWAMLPFAGLLIGYIAAYLALFIHEAGHFNIHPDKKNK